LLNFPGEEIPWDPVRGARNRTAEESVSGRLQKKLL